MTRLRAERGLTFDRLTEQLGRRRPNVIVYDKGTVAPTPAVLVELAAALGVEPAELTTASPETAELADLRVWAGKTIAEAAADPGWLGPRGRRRRGPSDRSETSGRHGRLKRWVSMRPR